MVTQMQINQLKRSIVAATVPVEEGHIPSAFSILDILWVLYSRVLHIDPNNPRSDNRGRFILSKGYGALVL